jgi:hypothetical protein
MRIAPGNREHRKQQRYLKNRSSHFFGASCISDARDPALASAQRDHLHLLRNPVPNYASV